MFARCRPELDSARWLHLHARVAGVLPAGAVVPLRHVCLLHNNDRMESRQGLLTPKGMINVINSSIAVGDMVVGMADWFNQLTINITNSILVSYFATLKSIRFTSNLTLLIN